MEYNLVATTTFGLEGITAKELKALGYEDLTVENGKVHFCKSRDATSLLSWDSFEDMLISESQRLFTLYDDRGRMLVSREKTLPI